MLKVTLEDVRRVLRNNTYSQRKCVSAFCLGVLASLSNSTDNLFVIPDVLDDTHTMD